MRPDLVVVLSPRIDHSLCFSSIAKPLHAQVFVAELAVEALGHDVLPRDAAWLRATVFKIKEIAWSIGDPVADRQRDVSTRISRKIDQATVS